jgi:ATP-dependent DNA helicase PIF1
LTSLHAVLAYLGKYVFKPEKSSLSYTELQAQVLPHVNNQAPALSFALKILNKLIGERDWFAQEVSHFLLSLPAQECSCCVITLDCRLAKDQNDLISVEEETITAW